jgi:hypothetical protein
MRKTSFLRKGTREIYVLVGKNEFYFNKENVINRVGLRPSVSRRNFSLPVGKFLKYSSVLDPLDFFVYGSAKLSLFSFDWYRSSNYNTPSTAVLRPVLPVFSTLFYLLVYHIEGIALLWNKNNTDRTVPSEFSLL